jgi:Protein of unknown function (DUF2934)
MATGGRALSKSGKERAAKTLPLEERIRVRAYEIYLQRGGEDGSELDDWLQAEQEILGAEPQWEQE